MGGGYRTPLRDLGERTARYESPAPVRSIVVVLLVFGLPGLALVSGFRSAPGQTFAGDRSSNVVLGALFITFTGYAIRALRLKGTLRIDEHANGLRWIARGLPRTVLWSDIAEIVSSRVSRAVASVEVDQTTVVRLRLENGRQLVMSSMVAGFDRLIDRIEREVGARIIDRARATLAGGGTATFGPVALTHDEVRLAQPSRAIPWSNLRSVEIAGGVISFRGEPHATIEIEWSKVANANALIALVNERLSSGEAA